MKKKNITLQKLQVIVLILSCLGLFSCEDVIQADLDTGEAKLVVDAEILWQKGTDGAVQTVKLSRMAGYYVPATPKVSGAQVYIENSTGTQFAFPEVEPGVYTCTNFVPALNETYTLHVTVDGEVFTATETLMPVTEIHNLIQDADGGFTGDEMEVAIYFNDPANQPNYYLISFITPTLAYPDYELTDDGLTDGNELKADYSHEDLVAGDSVQITLRGISHPFYNYMNLILSAADSNPFATPPANIKGNVLNQDANGSEALGYFRLCESDYRDYTIQ
ncbi:hypothetical protein AM493_06355 [Flavobacterium akiainvivens]|uniref:DUF4249 domain-containing protein n=1 Tax=Flavobacterium akiainvivens TaxID=1202724 RepID=A0A0N0RQL3_9FLAO|nr:DUF4249 domain-containing protein [Flavobacterium akiainvivens]KOS05699.1 hypothetical protein AM493_06355 [Flavobacterium akiainvivens]SFQ36893.1 protein of unknown function [Flavobacterium akiainvivens]